VRAGLTPIGSTLPFISRPSVFSKNILNSYKLKSAVSSCDFHLASEVLFCVSALFKNYSAFI